MGTWAVILILVALFLFALEILVPSGGLLGTVASVSLLGGLVCLYMVDITLGLVGTLITLIAIPIGVALAFKVFPHTPIGRRLVLSSAQKIGSTNYDPALENAESELVGQEGEALNWLRPVGACKFGDKRVECLAVGGTIEPGTKVKVVAVNGMEVKVRPV